MRRRRGAVIAKRGFDLVLASLLLVIAAPLILAIALAIKIDSPGAVLFRSPRIGRGGKLFGMLKFRTMVDRAHGQRDGLRHLSDAPEGVFKIRNDPRVTRVGKVLRRVSLDEMPQLWHVITGEMSLVGPRPLPPEEDELIEDDAPRTFVRPGLTGPWQVAGSWRIPLDEMLRLEREYLENWSLVADLKLLAVTFKYVLRARGV
ncbi:MAG: sugar transferase [Solirubrobacterales bacterium]|nr:sugar transferase [Solirubrobacterales bacterium]